MSNVVLNILSEFKGKAAFKQADTAVVKLQKSVRNLAGAVGIAYGTRAVVAFGKASVKAFAEDEKAALSLARTVQNLGLGFETQGESVNKYISALEQQTGVLDDELRPALDRLLRATLSITDAQNLLNLSLDIAAGTGKSVTQVSQSLQKAYLGQTQALGRLGVGLSKAELTSASFEEIQARLSYLFAGQAKDAAESYAGQIDKLTIASNNAKETIGKGLVDALVTVSNSGNVDGLVENINTVASAIAGATTQLSKFIIGFKYFSNPKNLFKGGGELNEIFTRIEMGKPLRNFSAGNNAVTGYQKDKALQAQALKVSAAQTKATKALTAEQKKQAALKKASSVFDIENAGLYAALQGKLTTEEANRVKALLALNNDNATAATYYSNLVLKAQDETGKLAKLIRDLPKAANPFSDWVIPMGIPASNAVDMSQNPLAGITQLQPGQSGFVGPTVNVNVAGSVISEQGLIDAVRGGLNVASLSGSGSTVRRIGGF